MTICVCGNDLSGYCPGPLQCDEYRRRTVKIDHNYLPQQFLYCDTILSKIRDIVHRGDFTLGREVELFEEEFARMVGVKYAVAVANGTDALVLAIGYKLRKHGEVITTPYSFYATTAAIVNSGGDHVFVDVGADFNIDVDRIESEITDFTVGILPVHWAGRPCNMDAIREIAEKHKLWIIEDCSHAHGSTYHGRQCGALGDIGTFSLHPLKNVNVWGDGGVITTDDYACATWLRKARNHGMIDRNTCEFWGHNSRLDTIQAVVARHVLGHLPASNAVRRTHAAFMDALLADVKEITLPGDATDTSPNYYLYSFHAERRDELRDYLVANGVDAKVHYPVPLHLQPASYRHYKRGDFPVAEWCADTTLSLPVHEYITRDQLETMGRLIHDFYHR